jgi:hypothetical protein
MADAVPTALAPESSAGLVLTALAPESSSVIPLNPVAGVTEGAIDHLIDASLEPVE